MKHDGSKAVISNEEEAQAAQQDLPSARPSLVPLRLPSAHDVPGNFAIEALLRQALEGDHEAWAAVEQCLGETVRRWLRGHSSKEAACSWESEEHYVSLAIERFRRAAIVGQLRACTSLSTCIGYLDHPFKNKPFETEKDLHFLLANTGGYSLFRWWIIRTSLLPA